MLAKVNGYISVRFFATFYMKTAITHDLFANLRVTVRMTDMSKNFDQSAKSSDKRSKFKSVICRMDAFRFGEKRPINENNITEA